MDKVVYAPILVFNFKEKNDSTNLFFGTKKKYSAAQLSAYALKSEDTILIKLNMEINYNSKDSSFITNFETYMNKIYFKVDNNVFDSIYLDYNKISSACTNGSEINNVNHNGKSVYTDSNYIYNFYK